MDPLEVEDGMRVVGCSVCGSEGVAPVSPTPEAFAGRGLLRCPACGFAFTAVAPTRPHGRPGDGGDPLSWPRRGLSRVRFGALHRWLLRLAGSGRGRLLDVGVGLGDLALFLSRRGWEVWGCDPAEDAARSCRQLLGERFAAAPIGAEELPPGSFDVVLMNFSLEHMDRPRAAVGRARELLRPGGVLAVRVPNVDPALDGRLGASFQLQPDHHCAFFGRRSLQRLLDGCGLEVLEVTTPASLLEGVSTACGLVPSLDPEQWMSHPAAPASLARAVALAVLAAGALPAAWMRCRRGQGAVLRAAARRPEAA